MVRKRKVAAVDDKRKGDLVKIVLPLLTRSHPGKVVEDHPCVQALVPAHQISIKYETTFVQDIL